MSDWETYRPATATEYYLMRIVDALEKRATLPDEQLREPLTTHSAVNVPLTDDFPGLAALKAAGIETFGDVPRTKVALLAIDGIGNATADRILEALLA